MTSSASRSLLLPGPLPPLSHFGVTLLRHVVATGLRYALYQLGAPAPERPPVRIVALRLYLDRERLASELGPAAGSDELVSALVEPAGVASAARGDRRLAGAARFHRVRLALSRPRRRFGVTAPAGGSPHALWRAFRTRLSTLQPALNEALLAELLACLARRRRRAGGERPAPAIGPQGWRLWRGRRADLGALGAPDPLRASWAGAPERAERARAALAAVSDRAPDGWTAPARDPLRGRFREEYRRLLDRLRPPYLALAEDAVARGLLEGPEDAFFLPFDLAADLAADRRPDWLGAAVRANRGEYETLLAAAGPPDLISGPRPSEHPYPPGDGHLAPLWPLP